MGTIDLHFHSIISDDGEFTPTALMERCAKNGVRVAALADHNSVRGVPEALRAAKTHGVTLIPATELDCTCGGVGLHVLGYNIDPAEPDFAENEQTVLAQAQAASGKMLELVRGLGLAVRDEDAFALAHDGVVTGEIIAEAALANPANEGNALLAPYRPGGARADNPFVNFYWDYCAQGKPAYVPIRYLTLKQAVALIERAGGIPVLAHPGNNVHEDASLLCAIADEGVRGIEVFSSYHTPKQTAFYRAQAELLGLFMTCGSDFHGKTKPAIELGSVDCAGAEEQMLRALGVAL